MESPFTLPGPDFPLSRLKEIVARGLELPAAERLAYLKIVCGDDRQLRADALSLLGLEAAATGFLNDSPMRPAESPRLEGRVLGAYRLLRPIGSGGMGDVYLAERADGAFDQQVAVKVIRRGAGLGELAERFASERQLLAELNHPNIANLLDGGATDDGRPYLVMEYVEGQPINAFCQTRGASVEERLKLFLKVCAAVQHAHRSLVVHRDLKPVNILVTADGEPKLLDFGVAKDLGGAGKTPETRLLVPVTPEYASPEQLTGKPATTAFDIYALGVVLYELLVGRSPFDGEDLLGGRSGSAPPAPPSTRISGHGSDARRLRRRLGGDLDHIVLRALAPDPQRRYASVEQLSRDLERQLDGLALETREGTLYRLGKMARRNWKWLAASAVAVGITGFWFDSALESRQLEREHQQEVRLTEELGKYLEDLFKEADPRRSGEWSEALERMLDRGAELLADGSFADKPHMRARLLGAIGQVYRSHDRPADAEPLLRENLAIRRQVLSPGDEWIAISCSNLAINLRDLGSYAEARSLLWETREILFQNHPGDHAHLATLLNNLASVEKELGLFDEAIDHYHQALQMKRRLAVDPARLANALKNLGSGLRAAGRLGEAEAAFRQVLVELARLEEPKLAYQAGAEHHLGAVLRDRDDLAAARQHLERAYDARVELYSEDHKKTIETLLELALLDQLEGLHNVAEERLRRVTDVRRRHLGDGHPLTGAALIPLARLLAEGGEVARAATLTREALGAFHARLPAGHWRIIEAEKLLAELGWSSTSEVAGVSSSG